MKLVFVLSTIFLISAQNTWAEVGEWDHQIEANCTKPLSQGKKKPCIRFVRKLEESAATAEKWVAIGTSYSWMIDFESASDVRERYRLNTIKAFQIASEIDPGNTDAWLGLATRAETKALKLKYLRNAREANLQDLFIATMLIRELRSLENPTQDDFAEVSDILESVYESTDGYDKWHMVRLADSDTKRGSDLISRARSDAAEKLMTIDIENNTDQALSRFLDEFCTIPIISLKLEDSCYSLLSNVIASKSKSDFLNERSVLAIERMLSARDKLVHRDSELLIRMRDFLEQIEKNGHRSAELYLQLSRVTTGGWRLDNLRHSVEISNESNAKALLWLGSELAKQGKRNAAIARLKRSESLNQEPYSSSATLELSILEVE